MAEEGGKKGLALRVSSSISKPVAEAPPALNPFLYNYTSKTLGQKLYWALKWTLGLVLIPTKTAVFVLYLLICVTCAKLAVMIGSGANAAPNRLERFLIWPVRFGGRFLLFLLGFYRVKTKGTPAKPEEAAIIVSNHVHFWEILYLFWTFGPSAVSRKENTAIPGVSALLKASRGILVDRYSPTSRHDTIEMIKERANKSKTDPHWPQILIFPEGSTTNNKSVCSFKIGAFAAGVPVQPVAVNFPYRHCDPCWSIDGPQMLYAILRMEVQFINYMEITFLPVYHPSPAEIANPQLYARNVRNLIARELGKPVSDHSTEDALLQSQALKYKIPLTGITSMQEMNRLLNMNFEEARELLARFGQAHTTGKVDFQGFCKFLKLPPSTEAQQLFEAWAGEANVIDIPSLVMGLHAINARGDSEEIIARSWQLFDHQGKGFLEEEDLVTVLLVAFPTMTEDDALALFKLADTKKSNKLTLEEFTRFWKKHPEYVAIASSSWQKWDAKRQAEAQAQLNQQLVD